MKRHGNLFGQITARSNIAEALRKASLGKKKRKNVSSALRHGESAIDEVRNLMISGHYKTSKFHTKRLFTPKLRIIYSLPFVPDRIAHHAMMNVLEPIWLGLMHNSSFSCIRGRGQHKASRRCIELAKKFSYVAQLDISQFYVNIDHEILKGVYRRKIKCPKTLQLLDELVDCSNIRNKNIEVYRRMIKAGQDVEAAKFGLAKLENTVNLFPNRKAGLAVGALPSQWMGNLYLTELDFKITDEWGFKNYIRFCDDLLIFSNDKQTLQDVVIKIRNYLFDQRLLVLGKERVYPTSLGIDFCGYRHFANGMILLRKSTAKCKKREMKGLMHELKNGYIDKLQAISKIASAEGLLKHANSYNLKKSLKLDELKKEVTDYAR